MATKKSSSSRRSSSSGRKSTGSTPKSKRIVKNKMEKVMHEFKHHQLSRGRGGKVKNPKQAIAIGLSEARRSGANIPSNPNQKKRASKKTASRKTTAKKSTTKRTTANKSTAKKRASKRTTKKAARKR
ncbi:MAG TPA: DUF6496 domain-containing protein [Bryobacteraceae bacterium]|jgi:hypothetical protein|nr:DUF6496 domain-containing protein [Bryobacteraceae bacterium]